ncbi:MAG: PAS domain S-box protein, partial [Chloroflexi bacterium]|nr:PAS domain S-box protein [Chloroflexota bacterium]
MEQARDTVDASQIKTSHTLAPREEIWRAIFEDSHLGVCFLDAQGVIEDCNERLARMAGTSVEGLVGFKATEQIRNEALLRTIQEALRGEAGSFEGEYTSATGGRTAVLRVTAKPVDPACRPTVVVLTAEDITERWRAEKSLRESEERFRQLVENINAVVYSVDA